MLIRTVALAGALSLTAACASNRPSPPDTGVVRASIEAANGRFLDAFRKADKAGLTANYADDAMLMMPNVTVWRGHQAIDQGFTAFLSQMSIKDGGAVTGDVMVSGDLAVETGTFAWTFATKAGAEVKDKGKYVTVWKHQPDGGWKIIRDINNSDLPAGQ